MFYLFNLLGIIACFVTGLLHGFLLLFWKFSFADSQKMLKFWTSKDYEGRYRHVFLAFPALVMTLLAITLVSLLGWAVYLTITHI